jgi:hypothetical protein
MYDILRYLKGEIDATKDRILFHTPGTDPDLVAHYNYRIGYLSALIHTQEWVKELEAKKMQQDLE